MQLHDEIGFIFAPPFFPISGLIFREMLAGECAQRPGRAQPQSGLRIVQQRQRQFDGLRVRILIKNTKTEQPSEWLSILQQRNHLPASRMERFAFRERRLPAGEFYRGKRPIAGKMPALPAWDVGRSKSNVQFCRLGVQRLPQNFHSDEFRLRRRGCLLKSSHNFIRR